MNKEYWLLKRSRKYEFTEYTKVPFRVVDRVNASNLRYAEIGFKKNNNFEKLLQNSKLAIFEFKKVYHYPKIMKELKKWVK